MAVAQDTIAVICGRRETMNIIEQLFKTKEDAAIAEWPEMAGKPYRPGSGIEGMFFDDVWCSSCARDAEYRKNIDGPDSGCQILAATFRYKITDPAYPKQWIYDRTGKPCCTAFTTDPRMPERCDKTLELFETGMRLCK